MFDYFSNSQLWPLLPAILLLAGSYLLFSYKRITISILLLIAGTFMLGCFVSLLDTFLHLWDEQFHALVAKNMTLDPFKPMLFKNPILPYNENSWTTNHIWLHKQPLFLWQIALSIKLFGINAFSVRLPSIIMHAIIPFFIFRIGSISINQRTAYFSALLFAVAYFPLELSAGLYATDHNDLAFLFYVSVTFWAWFEYMGSKHYKWLVLIGLCSGAAILVKWLVGLLVYLGWGISLLSDRKTLKQWKTYLPLLTALTLTAVVFLPWQLYIMHFYPEESAFEYAFNTRHFFEVLDNHSGSVWYHFSSLKTLYGSGDLVPILLSIGAFICYKKIVLPKYKWFIFCVIIAVYFFFTLAATKMIAFCLIVSPMIYLFLGSLMDAVFLKLEKWIRKLIIVRILTVLTVITGAYLMLNIEQIQNNHTLKKKRENGRVENLREMEFIEKITTLPVDNYVVFTSDLPLCGNIPVMFFTNYTSYNGIPTKSEMEFLEKNGYLIVLPESENLPDYILDNEKITRIRL